VTNTNNFKRQIVIGLVFGDNSLTLVDYNATESTYIAHSSLTSEHGVELTNSELDTLLTDFIKRKLDK
jgi:hypothetical protein